MNMLSEPLRQIDEADDRPTHSDRLARSRATTVWRGAVVSRYLYAPRRATAVVDSPRGRRLCDVQQRAHLVLESIAEPVIVVDGAGYVEYLNPSAEALLGRKNEDAAGRPFDEVCRLIHEDSRQPVRFGGYRHRQRQQRDLPRPCVLLLTGDGQELAVHQSVAPMQDGSRSTVIVLHDVSPEREAALQLSYLATHDALTGLVNRFEVEQRIARVVARAHQDRSRHALAYLDLDLFKAVNDTSGHAAGDELLRRFAELVQAHVRTRDTVARLGGDEFVILLEHCSLGRAQAIIEGLMKAIDRFRFRWEDRCFRIGASIGLAAIGHESEDAAAVLAAADAACYEAKHAGRNQLVIHGASGMSACNAA